MLIGITVSTVRMLSLCHRGAKTTTPMLIGWFYCMQSHVSLFFCFVFSMQCRRIPWQFNLIRS
jgi:hypothetical protein